MAKEIEDITNVDEMVKKIGELGFRFWEYKTTTGATILVFDLQKLHHAKISIKELDQRVVDVVLDGELFLHSFLSDSIYGED